MARVDGVEGEYPELSCLESMQTKSSVLVVV